MSILERTTISLAKYKFSRISVIIHLKAVFLFEQFLSWSSQWQGRKEKMIAYSPVSYLSWFWWPFYVYFRRLHLQESYGKAVWSHCLSWDESLSVWTSSKCTVAYTLKIFFHKLMEFKYTDTVPSWHFSKVCCRTKIWSEQHCFPEACLWLSMFYFKYCL